MDKELILVGDKLLVEPDASEGRTDAGLYLPQNVKEKEKIQAGKIIKVGPGYPVFDPSLLNPEPWARTTQQNKYFPLQAREGDYCIFLREQGVEIEFEHKHYIVISHSAILALVRQRHKPNLEED